MTHKAGRRTWTGVGALVACALLAAPAAADRDLDAAREAYKRGEFKRALTRLEAVARNPSKSEDDIVQLYWLQGACQFAMGKEAEAATSFDALVRLRPLHQPESWEASPTLRAVFADRATRFHREHGVQLGPPSVDGASLVVPLVKNGAEVAVVAVFARGKGAITFESFELPASGLNARGELRREALWKDVQRTGTLELALEARNARGVPLVRQGDALAPVSLDVDATASAAALRALTPVPPPTPTVSAAAVSSVPGAPRPGPPTAATPQPGVTTSPAGAAAASIEPSAVPASPPPSTATSETRAATDEKLDDGRPHHAVSIKRDHAAQEEGSAPSPLVLLGGGLLVLGAPAGAFGIVLGVVAAATWGVFGASAVALATWVGIQRQSVYQPLVNAYTYSFTPALVLTGLAAGVGALGVLVMVPGVLLLVIRAVLG